MKNITIKLPPGFLKAEDRGGYIVTEKMKKVWAVELDLLAQLEGLCRQERLRYFASGGTMLGAVRHGGFIPWDDDIDIIMPRKDYDRLLLAAPGYFREPYFLQTEYSDPGSLRPNAQLRNSRTCGILKMDLVPLHGYNQGIFIDIFPLDSIPDGEKEAEEHLQKCRQKMRRYVRFENLRDNYVEIPGKSLKHHVREGIHWMMTHPLKGIDRDIFFRDFEREVKRFNGTRTRRIGTVVPMTYYEKEDLRRRIMMDFEFMKIPVAAGYDRILTGQYGDWRTPKEGGSVHGDILFDTERSYLEVLDDIRSGRISV